MVEALVTNDKVKTPKADSSVVKVGTCPTAPWEKGWREGEIRLEEGLGREAEATIIAKLKESVRHIKNPRERAAALIG